MQTLSSATSIVCEPRDCLNQCGCHRHALGMPSITIHPELTTELSMCSTQPQGLITHNTPASRTLVGTLLTSFLINVFFEISLDLQENSTQPRKHPPGPPSSCIVNALCKPSTLITTKPPTLLTEFRLVQFLQFSHSSPFLDPESNPRSHTALTHLSSCSSLLWDSVFTLRCDLDRHYLKDTTQRFCKMPH